MSSSITPIPESTLIAIQFIINDPARFTKNLPIIYEIYNTRFGRPGRSLVPGAIVVPILVPHEDDLDLNGDRVYPLVPRSTEMTVQAFSRFTRLQKLADAELAIDSVLLPALVAFILSLLSQGSRDTLSTYTAFAASQLAFDHIALWALICKTHQQQNQSARLSYLSQ